MSSSFSQLENQCWPIKLNAELFKIKIGDPEVLDPTLALVPRQNFNLPLLFIPVHRG